jgi:hypothetical protein
MINRQPAKMQSFLLRYSAQKGCDNNGNCTVQNTTKLLALGLKDQVAHDRQEPLQV